MLTLIKVWAILTIVSLIVSAFSYYFSYIFNHNKIADNIFIKSSVISQILITIGGVLVACMAIAKICSLSVLTIL